MRRIGCDPYSTYYRREISNFLAQVTIEKIDGWSNDPFFFLKRWSNDPTNLFFHYGIVFRCESGGLLRIPHYFLCFFEDGPSIFLIVCLTCPKNFKYEKYKSCLNYTS